MESGISSARARRSTNWFARATAVCVDRVSQQGPALRRFWREQQGMAHPAAAIANGRACPVEGRTRAACQRRARPALTSTPPMLARVERVAREDSGERDTDVVAGFEKARRDPPHFATSTRRDASAPHSFAVTCSAVSGRASRMSSTESPVKTARSCRARS